MKKNTFKLAIVLLLLVVSCFCCKKDTSTNIDSKINITMVESSDTPLPTLIFVCRTVKIYSYYHDIIFNCQQSLDNIDIQFLSIEQNPLPASNPAEAVINLGTLNNGTYHLNIYVGKVKYKGKLIVSSESYSVNFKNNSIIHFTNSTLNRIV